MRIRCVNNYLKGNFEAVLVLVASTNENDHLLFIRGDAPDS